MRGRVLAIAGGGIAAAALLVGAAGFVSAQGPGPGGGPGPNAAMHAQMHGAGQTGPHHEQMQAAIASALGITVDELQAEMAAGKTVATIAQERGVSLDTLRAAMQAAHQAAGMPGAGMGPRGMMGPRAGMGAGTGPGACPHAQP